jgi:hypothetical protein
MDTNERTLMLLGEIREEIGGLRADVRNSDRRFDELHRLLADRKETDASLDKRITKLEHAHTRFMTFAGLVSAGVSALFAVGLAYVKGLGS